MNVVPTIERNIEKNMLGKTATNVKDHQTKQTNQCSRNEESKKKLDTIGLLLDNTLPYNDDEGVKI